MYAVDPETVGQYTGRKDKNGNRIFEGDIVAWNGQNMEVYWDDLSFAWRPLRHGWVESITGFIDEYEVIGNIHDNKSLLNNQESGE